jgi:HSP20 family protein
MIGYRGAPSRFAEARRPGPADPTPAGAAETPFPPVNIGQTATHLNLYVFLPGVPREAIDLSVEPRTIRVAGHRPERPSGPAEAPQTEVWRRERPTGPFERRIPLPGDVDTHHVEARYRNGILHVTLARVAPSSGSAHRVAVQQAEVNDG